MKGRQRTRLVLLSMLITGLWLSQVAPCLGQPDRPQRHPFDWEITPEEFERLRLLIPLYFTVKTVVDTINSALILVLVAIQIGVYRRTGSNFSLGLVVFSVALLMYTVFANPLVNGLLGFRRIGFGPLLIVPDIFTLIASVILLYLSRQ